MCNCGRSYRPPVASVRGVRSLKRRTPRSVSNPSSDQAVGQPVVPTAPRRFRRGIYRRKDPPIPPVS